jgi:hypothetical protein
MLSRGDHLVREFRIAALDPMADVEPIGGLLGRGCRLEAAWRRASASEKPVDESVRPAAAPARAHADSIDTTA